MSRPTQLTPEIEFWLGAMTDGELAELVHKEAPTVLRWRRAAGIAPNRGTWGNCDRDSAILAQLLSVQNAALVAGEYGLSRERVRAIAEAGGLKKIWAKKGKA